MMICETSKIADADDELLNAHVLVAEGRTEPSESAAAICGLPAPRSSSPRMVPRR